VAWRVFVAAFIGAVICTPPEFVALSLMTAFAGSALGMIGGLLSLALAVANFGVSVVAAGWAMSKVAAAQIETGVAEAPDVTLPIEPGPLASPSLEPEPLQRIEAEMPAPVAPPAPVVRAVTVATTAPGIAAAPIAAAAPVVAAPPVVAAAAPAARSAPPAPAPRPAVAADRPQCPKCSLYETERGTVIGWYCKVCGWREGKSR